MPARVRTPALVLCALLLGSCGQDEPLTHAELVERADAICTDAFARVREIGADLPEPTPASVERWAEALGRTIPILRDMTGDLRALEPPPADADGFGALFDAFERATRALEDVRAAAEAGDDTGMSQPSEEATLAWVEADHVAGRLGLAGCQLFREETAGPSA